jgi:hypothetical protein
LIGRFASSKLARRLDRDDSFSESRVNLIS